jgi:hypothetical protein
MNIILMLILALLTMASLLPLGYLSTVAPKLAGPGASADIAPEDKKPLNLIVFITESGFNFSVQGNAKMGEVDPNNTSRKLASIPITRNAAGEPEFNYQALQEKLEEFKKLDPAEEAMTITADPEVKFDVVVQTMDAARFDTEKKLLFPRVSFAAGLVG